MRNVRKFIFLLSCFFSLSCPLSYAADTITMEKADYITLKQLVQAQQSDLTTVSKQSEALEAQLTTVSAQSRALETQLVTAQNEISELAKSLKEQTRKTESEKNKNKVYEILLVGLSAYIIVH